MARLCSGVMGTRSLEDLISYMFPDPAPDK